MRTPARNPFYHQDNPVGPPSVENAPPGSTVPKASAADVPGPHDGVERVERVDKPWGHEEIFAVLEGQYVGKVLHVMAGGVMSLQRHQSKDETVAVQAGQVMLEHGADRTRLTSVLLNPGDRFLIRAGVLHRITAIVDSQVLEASTAREGWRQDVVRLEDRYGRKGTSSP